MKDFMIKCNNCIVVKNNKWTSLDVFVSKLRNVWDFIFKCLIQHLIRNGPWPTLFFSTFILLILRVIACTTWTFWKDNDNLSKISPLKNWKMGRNQRFYNPENFSAAK